jgi:RES domain-containing protein
VIYAALSLASAMFERLTQTNGAKPPSDLWIEIEIPDGLSVETLNPDTLPGWDAEDRKASQLFGDRWLAECRTVVLIVPAMIGKPVERNVVINPLHADFPTIKASAAQPVIWDDRIFARSDR